MPFDAAQVALWLKSNFLLGANETIPPDTIPALQSSETEKFQLPHP